MCVLLAVGCLAAPSRAASPPSYSAWQEIVLLTVIKVRHAAAQCGYRGNEGGLDSLLGSAAMSREDVDRQETSPALTRQITADADAYGGDREVACAQAWNRFGPDGAPGLRDLLGH